MDRMFAGSLQEEVKALEEDIESVRGKVEDAVMCEKVRLFINAPREIQAIYKADAGAYLSLSLPSLISLSSHSHSHSRRNSPSSSSTSSPKIYRHKPPATIFPP